MTETFYDVLGVAEDATTEEIESAYREAIKEVHPDVSDDADAAERTKRLNRAKRVLTDESERSRYDRVGHEAYVDDSPGNTPGTARTAASDGDDDGGRRAGDSSGRSWSERARDATGGEYEGESTWRGRDSRRRAHSRRRRRDRGRSESGTSDSDGTGTDGQSVDDDASAADTSASESTSKGSASSTRTSSSGSASASGDTPWDSGFGGAEDTSRSARRQAAAAGPDSPNAEWSWNTWNPQDAWAVREGEGARGLRMSRLFPSKQSVTLLGSSFVCYPFFVGAILFPAFPLFVRLVVAGCTLLMFGYLLSVPEVAILVYGAWSLLGTLGLLVVPGIGLLSLAGLVVLVAAWIPFGLSVVTLWVLHL
jgi:curved DNA-binding protein CbpA